MRDLLWMILLIPLIPGCTPEPCAAGIIIYATIVCQEPVIKSRD